MKNTTEVKKWAEVDSNNPYFSANNVDFGHAEVLEKVLDYYCPDIK